MARPYCQRCQTEVLLEQDGTTCSNCGGILIPQPPTNPQSIPKPNPTRQPRTQKATP